MDARGGLLTLGAVAAMFAFCFGVVYAGVIWRWLKKLRRPRK